MFAGRIQATEADDQIAQGGQIVGSMSGADGGAIFAEGDIADVVDRIFNGPVTSAKELDFGGAHLRGWATGQKNFRFFGHAHRLEMMSRAADDGGLGGVREAGVLRSDFEGVDLASLMPAVALVQSDVRREKKRPLGLGKAGRVARRAWADWL